MPPKPSRLTRRSLLVRAALTVGSGPALSLLLSACTDGAPSTSSSAIAPEPLETPTRMSTAVPPRPSPTPPTARPSVPAKVTPLPTQAPSPTRQPPPATVGRAEAPKTVRIGLTQAPVSLAGWPGRSRSTDLVHNLLFNWLIAVNDKMQPVPDLAEEVPTLENGGARFVGNGADRQLQVSFALRRNALWSNGDPVTSQDVKFSWELLINPASAGVPDLELKYERVDTPDQFTAVFVMFSERTAREAADRDRDRYGQLSLQSGPVVDPMCIFGLVNSPIWPSRLLLPLVDGLPRTSRRAAEAITSGSFASRPVGSGPYVLGDSNDANALAFSARAEYHRGAPKMQSVTFIVAKRDSLADALKSGGLDVVTDEDARALNVQLIPDQGPTRLYVVPSSTWENLSLNLDHPILKDKAVRRALYHAIDRKAIAEASQERGARPISSIIPEWSWAYAADVPAYDYSPQKAEEILEAAGWKKDPAGKDPVGKDPVGKDPVGKDPAGVRVKDSARLRLIYRSTDAPHRQRVAGVLREQWKRIGVELIVEHYPAAVFHDGISGPLATRSFEVAQLAWIGRFDPGADAVYQFHSQSIPALGNGLVGGNYAGYSRPDSDRLLASGLAILTVRERARIYQEWQRLAMDDLPVLPLYSPGNVSVASTRLRNFRPPVLASIGETWNVEEWDLT